jgi:hypothetical protein
MFAPAPSAKSFLARTYEMLQDSRNESAVAWGRDGTSITLVNVRVLVETLLPCASWPCLSRTPVFTFVI